MAIDIDNIQTSKVTQQATEASSLGDIAAEVAAQAADAPPLEEALILNLTLPPGHMPGERYVQSEADRDAVHQHFMNDDSGWATSTDAKILLNQILAGLAPVPEAIDLPSEHFVKTEADRDAVYQYFTSDTSGWSSSSDAKIWMNQILNGLAPAPKAIELPSQNNDVRR